MKKFNILVKNFLVIIEKLLHMMILCIVIYLCGREIFQNTLKNWELDYSEKKSLTSEESFLVNVKKIKKKIKKN